MMDLTKDFTFKDIMQFAHDVEEFQEDIEMLKWILGDDEFLTTKKE